MGCGMSTMDPEDATPSRISNPLRRNKTARPVVDNSLGSKKILESEEQSLDSLPKQSGQCVSSQGNKEVCMVVKSPGEHEMKRNWDERIKEKKGNGDHHNKEESEKEGGNDREDHICKGPGSPSFRDYCVDHKPKLPNPRKKTGRGDPSFSEYFNDNNSGESTKNEGEDDSTKPVNKPQKEEGTNSHQQEPKKESTGRGLRNVINKGRSGKKKILLSCYTASQASCTEGSVQKMVGKAA